MPDGSEYETPSPEDQAKLNASKAKEIAAFVEVVLRED